MFYFSTEENRMPDGGGMNSFDIIYFWNLLQDPRESSLLRLFEIQSMTISSANVFINERFLPKSGKRFTFFRNNVCNAFWTTQFLKVPGIFSVSHGKLS